MKNIVITNVYGYKNLGDGAILEGALRVLDKAIPDKKIHLHSATSFTIKNRSIKNYLHPYGLAIKTNKGPVSNFTKLSRFPTIVLNSLFYTFLEKISPNSIPDGDYSYIKSIKDADIVLGIGGGYFRTKNKYTDYFGLLLTLLPIYIAHVYKKRVLYLPMSYGNFASENHAKLVSRTLQDDVIIFRDKTSLKEFNKYVTKKSSTHLIPDLALFDNFSNKDKSKKDYVVLTARLWMDKTSQKRYEQELAYFIDYIWNNYKLKTFFIPMAWNKIEDDDERVAVNIKKLLTNKNIFEVKNATEPEEVKKLLSNAKVSICTRMHSAILSTVVRTPFITIAYEHKTLGFLEHMGLEKWNIDIQDLSFVLLKKKFDDLINNQYTEFISTLNDSHTKIKKQEEDLIKVIKDFK